MKIKQLKNLTRLEQSIIINHIVYGIGLSKILQGVVDANNINKDNVTDIMHSINKVK